MSNYVDHKAVLSVLKSKRSIHQMINMIVGLPEIVSCEDAVSKEHLLHEIAELMKSPWFNNGKDDDTFTHYGYVERKEAVEIIRDLCVKAEPPVIPARKKGKWINVGSTIGLIDDYRCSECNHEPERKETNGTWGWSFTKFCPNCGIEMENGGDNI